MELSYFQLMIISFGIELSYSAKPCYRYNSEKTETCFKFIINWSCKTEYRKVVKCCDGYRGENYSWSGSPPNFGCSTPRCRGGYGSNTCNVNGEGYVKHRNGRIVTSSGGTCDAPSTCVNCNDGYYAVKDDNGYCKACVKPSNCNLPKCTSENDVICDYCVGEYFQDKPGYNVYTHIPDPRRCQGFMCWPNCT